MPRSVSLAGCFALVAAIASAAEYEATVIPLSDSRFPARLAGIDAKRNVHFTVADKERSLPADELVAWGARRDAQVGPLVQLTDGTVVLAEVASITADELKVESSLLGRMTLPSDKVRGIVFRPPAVPLDRDRLSARLGKPPTDPAKPATRELGPSPSVAPVDTDLIFLESGDTLRGTLLGLSEDGTVLQLDTSRGNLGVGLKKTIGVAFNPTIAPLAPRSPRELSLGLADGSCLRVDTLGENGGKLELTLVCGFKLALDDPAEFWSRVVYLSVRHDRIAWLSELPPLGYKHVPFLDLAWPYQLDRNVLGGALRVHGLVYDHGLGMHSSSRLAWNIPAGYRQFQAELALDDEAGTAGSVVYRVYLGTAEGKLALAYESPVIRGGETPLPVTVDLKDARQLALIVDFADRGDILDHADWLSARLVK